MHRLTVSLILALTFAVCAGCSDSEDSAEDNRALVTRFFQEVLIEGDLDYLDELVAEDYIQHSSLAADGRAGVRDALPNLAGLSVETHRVLVDGDVVATHSTYQFPGADPLVGFDVFRVQGGRLVEHWDALAPLVPQTETVSGRSMVDGPTDPGTGDASANRQLVTEFIQVVLTEGDFSRLGEYVSEDYAQHNPLVGDGLEGLSAFAGGLAEQGLTFGYTRSPLVVAEGDFVLVGSEGVFGPVDAPAFAVFYDLFRVRDGLLVEHWDIIPPEPPTDAELPHDNGWF